MISVMLPTRARPDLLAQCLLSLEATRRTDVEVILRIDDDDALTREFVDRVLPTLGVCPVIALSGPRYEGYKSIPRFMIELAERATGDPLLFVSDDAVFQTPGWDEAIVEAAVHFPDGICSVAPNPWFNPEVRPLVAVGRGWFRALGHIIDPRIFWGDVYIRDVAQALGREIYLQDIVIEHRWARTRREDAQAQEPAHVTPEYWARHREIVAETIAKLRPLLVAQEVSA